jgi:hypothetical protein
LLRAAAERYGNFKASRTVEIKALTDRLAGAHDRIVTCGGIEIAPVPVSAEFKLRASLPEIDGTAKSISTYERDYDPGPELEEKIRFVPDGPGRPLANALWYSASTWREPHQFHVAVLNGMKPVGLCRRIEFRNQPDAAAAHDDALARHVVTIATTHMLLERLLTGAALLPSIASVHAIVQTSDHNVVEAQRSLRALYHPGAWAPTFEEQMIRRDLAAANGVIETIRRGLAEEFGLSLRPDEILLRAASLVAEWPTLNIALCCHVDVTRPGADFRYRSDDPDSEIIMARATPWRDRRRQISRSDVGYWYLEEAAPWHPTAPTRLALLTRSNPS